MQKKNKQTNKIKHYSESVLNLAIPSLFYFRKSWAEDTCHKSITQLSMYISKQNCKLTTALHRTLNWRTTHNCLLCILSMQCISYSSVLKTQLEMFSKENKKSKKRKTPGLGTFLKFLLFCFRKWDPANKNYRKHFSVCISFF